MSRWAWRLAGILAAALAAHGLAFFLAAVLPDAAIIALGFEGANQDVVAAFHAARHTRPYGQVLFDLLHLDFGKTLDGVAVGSELMRAVVASLPRLIGALVLVLGAVLLASLTPVTRGKTAESLARLVAFLPPYLMPFLGLVALLSLTFQAGMTTGTGLTAAVTTIALALGPSALIFVQARNVVRRNLETEFARMLLAVGATPFRQQANLMHNVIAELAPSLEKMVTSMMAVLLFLEPIFGVDGFGTTAVRAIKRSDIDLILGVTVVTAACVGVCRIVAGFTRRYYDLEP